MACDAIYRLPGWEQSVGARAESALAEWMGKAIMDAARAVPNMPYPPPPPPKQEPARTCQTCRWSYDYEDAPTVAERVNAGWPCAACEYSVRSSWSPRTASTRPPSRETILSEAARLTSADRQRQYGHPREHFARTAAALTARFSTGADPLFRRVMDPQEWPLMMALDKLAGRGQDTRAIKRDSLVDVAGYCRTIEMCGEPGNTVGQGAAP
jgi:hypothetical protein